MKTLTIQNTETGEKAEATVEAATVVGLTLAFQFPADDATRRMGFSTRMGFAFGAPYKVLDLDAMRRIAAEILGS